MYKNILVKDIHKVRLVELNRPKSLNALNKELLKELAEILNETDKNKKIRCVVITGNEKSFSSGADMKEAPESEMPFWAEKNRLLSWKTIENFKKPQTWLKKCLNGEIDLKNNYKINKLLSSSKTTVRFFSSIIKNQKNLT